MCGITWNRGFQLLYKFISFSGRVVSPRDCVLRERRLSLIKDSLSAILTGSSRLVQPYIWAPATDPLRDLQVSQMLLSMSDHRLTKNTICDNYGLRVR